MSKDIRTPKNKCLRFGEFLGNPESDDGACDAGAFQGKRIQLICVASRIGWPAVLLQSYAFPVLTSMFSSTLKSAVTFTVTSQHALCFFPWDQAPVFCPWVWLTMLYHGRKG